METLKQAIAALYSPVCGNEERKQADAWLQSFLHSDQAWPLSMELLRENTMKGPSREASGETLFCARALHILLRVSVNKTQKRQKSHVVLTEADWAGMREALLVLTRGYAADLSNRLVLTQLALAVATLTMKMEHWEAERIVPDLVAWFRAQATPASGTTEITALVEVLRVLPEEVNNKAVSVRPDRRALVVHSLVATAPIALNMMQYACTVQPPQLQLQATALNAFAGWIETMRVPHALVHASPLLPHAFSILTEAQQLLCNGTSLEAAAGGYAHAALDAAVAVATSALTVAAPAKDGQLLGTELQRLLLEQLVPKLKPAAGTEHLALRESVMVLAHAVTTMQVHLPQTGGTVTLAAFLEPLVKIAQHLDTPHDVLLEAMQPWGALQGLHGSNPDALISPIEQAAYALVVALSERLGSVVCTDDEEADGDSGQSDELVSLVGDVAEVTAGRSTTRLYQQLQSNCTVAVRALSNEFTSSADGNVVWQRVAGNLIALQASTAPLKKQDCLVLTSQMLLDISTNLLPVSVSIVLSNPRRINQTVKRVAKEAAALIAAMGSWLGQSEAQLWQGVVAALCTALRDCLQVLGSTEGSEGLLCVTHAIALSLVKCCQHAVQKVLDGGEGMLGSLVELYYAADQLATAQSHLNPSVKTHTPSQPESGSLADVALILLRSLTFVIPHAQPSTMAEDALKQALEPIVSKLERQVSGALAGPPGDLWASWRSAREMTKCAVGCRHQAAQKTLGHGGSPQNSTRKPVSDVVGVTLARLWGPVVGTLQPPNGALIEAKLIEQVLEVLVEAVLGAAYIPGLTTAPDAWLLEMLPHLLDLLMAVFQQHGRGLTCVVACTRVLAGRSAKVAAQSVQVLTNPTVDAALVSVGELVLRLCGVVSMGGGDKLVEVATEFFPLMRECMLVPLPQFASVDNVQMLAQCLHRCLSGTSGEEARVALAFAQFVLTFPWTQRALQVDENSARFQWQQQLVGAVESWINSPGASGGGMLTLWLMEAANGAMPPSHVIDVATALHGVLEVVGQVVFTAWLEEALRINPNFPRPGLADTAKAAFVLALMEEQCKGDVRYFKRVLKSFCGGKKKGIQG